ncbi:MAG: hypothetical protein IJO06_05870 [Thermoguttaceae bacterium]|nr:hypothetical protein [Thermoguttaceae bacterium]
MKRTAKNERTNEKNAAKRRRNRDAVRTNATRSTELSRAFCRSTVALALTCGVCVGVSGCQSFLGADDERFRQGRGEYALDDETVVRDWEQAARETGQTTRNGEVGEDGQKGGTRQDEENDPAASRPILRSAAFDEEREGAERRVAVRKPVSESAAFEENDAPKSFSERVKGLFSRPKKEPRRSDDPRNADLPVRSRNSADLGKLGNSGDLRGSGGFAKSGDPKKTARPSESAFSLGRGLTNVFPPSKRRQREKFPVDPVLQYDESRFMPGFQTCEQYRSPILAAQTPGEPLTSAKSTEAKKRARTTNLPQTARTEPAAVASRSSAGRQGSVARISGRQLVAEAQNRRASGTATSGAVPSKSSETGWGKTRPIAIAANVKSATAKGAVAPVGYTNASRKNRTDFRTLTARCDGFFGWEAGDETLLNAISEPTQSDETLTAYSSASAPTASVLADVPSSAFAVDVAEIATANKQSASLGQDAATLTAYVANQTPIPVQNDALAPVATASSNESTAEVGEGARVGENGATAQNAATLTAYAPSAPSKNESAPSNVKTSSDFAAQLGETNFDWFDSRLEKGATQPSTEAATVATLASESAASVPNATPNEAKVETLELISGEPRVDLDAALANRLTVAEVGGVAETLPVAPSPVAEVGEVAETLPVAPSSVAEVGEVAETLPVAPSSVAEVGEVAETLPVAPSPVAEVGGIAETLPVAPSPVAEVGEVAEILPVAPSSVAEVGEVAETLPVSGVVVPVPVAKAGETAQSLTPVAAETLDVEAPQALVAVETENATGEENGVAGPNFALAAPGLGAGEAIQNAADERKDAAVAKPLSGDEIAWVEQIKSAIRTLVAERDAKNAAGEDVRRLDARLRLLYLAVDEYDRSIQEIQDDADPLKLFWETERGELETLLQSRLEEIDPTFVAERLRAGLDSLSGLCDLQIRKSALVVAPACFGLYEERAEAFQPGETVFAYAELEYVSCRETEEGRLIDVECRWRILNADGSELTPVETQRCSNLSETKLRDVVLNVSAPLPKDLAPGTYLLETEVVDMNRPDAKPAKERLKLTVVAGKNVEKAAE